MDNKVIELDSVQSHRTGMLIGVTKEEIDRVLGFKSHRGDPGNVDYEWNFSYNGREYSIWDWRGSAERKTFSTFGNRDGFVELFGPDKYLTY